MGCQRSWTAQVLKTRRCSSSPRLAVQHDDSAERVREVAGQRGGRMTRLCSPCRCFCLEPTPSGRCFASQSGVPQRCHACQPHFAGAPNPRIPRQASITDKRGCAHLLTASGETLLHLPSWRKPFLALAFFFPLNLMCLELILCSLPTWDGQFSPGTCSSLAGSPCEGPGLPAQCGQRCCCPRLPCSPHRWCLP